MCFSDVLAHNLYMGCLSTFSSVLEMLLFVQTISGILDISLLFSQLNFFLHGWKHNKDSLLNIRASLVSMLFFSLFQVRSLCHILRIRWEATRSRTKQRALLMMENLVSAKLTYDVVIILLL